MGDARNVRTVPVNRDGMNCVGDGVKALRLWIEAVGRRDKGYPGLFT